MTDSEEIKMQLPVCDIPKISLNNLSKGSITWDNARKIGKNAASIINRKRFLRQRLGPVEEAEVARVFERAVLNSSSVLCSMLWGIGTKLTCGHPEKAALHQLMLLEAAVRNEWSAGLKISMVFADVHARVNKISEKTIGTYFKRVKALLEDFVMLNTELVLLSDLWSAENKTMEDITPRIAILDKLNMKSSLLFITKNAAKRYHGEDIYKGALEYIATRLIDKEVLTHHYPNSLHLTYNNPKTMSFVQPNTPVLYVWSIHQGVSRAPWFSENEENS